jgi:hypothetical protein
MDRLVEREVVPADWREFCASWGLSHKGWLVTLRIEGGAVLAHDRALRGVELKGPHALVFRLDGSAPSAVDVDEVTKIHERSSDGRHAGLRIERASGSAVVVSFRVPSLPEMLDGLADSER